MANSILDNFPDLEENQTAYSIRSCFRTGDENPFTGQNRPNVTISCNGNIMLEDTPITIATHKIVLSANYQQDRFIQWRTYKWSLVSEDGSEIYYQTPIGYDNNIKAIFYGLKGSKVYNIVLIIETNDNRELSFTRSIMVNTGNVHQADWLVARSDCGGYYSDSETGDIGSNIVTIDTHGRIGTLYKCEIWPTGEQEEPIYHLVGENVGPIIHDYNVANHRWYKYVFRFSNTDYAVPIQTAWAGWTITELTPVGTYGHLLSYSADSTGVWKFKYNVSAGSQTQNLSKSSHDTLGRFPYFSFGRTNYESGSVTCLLGREMIPYDISPNKSIYVYKDGKWQWEFRHSPIRSDSSQIVRGGYTERLPNNQAGFRDLGSNEKINMLNQWKKFCASGSPKLLKDEKGNSYIVQILNTSSETQNNIYGRPEQISFEWQQIADAKNYIITSGEKEFVFEFGPNLRQYDEEQDIYPSDGISWVLTKTDGSQVAVGLTPNVAETLFYDDIKKFEVTKITGNNVYIYYTLDGESEEQKVENETWGLDLTGPISITQITYAD